MTPEITITYLLLIHWLGDFIFQTQKMAMNKSKNIYWLITHVVVYTFTFFIALVFLFDFAMVIAFCFFTFFAHLATDYVTSRWTSKFNKEKKYYGFPAFFSVIGLDQFLHQGQLILYYVIFLS